MSASEPSAASIRLGIAALVATAALWGTNHVVARAVHEMVPLPALAFWRWTIGATLLTIAGWASLRRCWPAIRSELWSLGIGGVLGVGIFSYLLLGGAYLSPALEVGFINATTPVWVALIVSMRGREAVSLRTWVGMAIAFAGTVLIIAKGNLGQLAGLQFSIGNLWSLLGAITFAWFSVQLRRWMRTIDPLAVTVVTAWFGVILVMLPVYLYAVATGSPWFTWSDTSQGLMLGAIAYVGIGPTMLGNLFYLYGVVTNGPARAATFLYLSPVFSALLAVTWLGETLAWFHALGFFAIIIGLKMIELRR